MGQIEPFDRGRKGTQASSATVREGPVNFGSGTERLCRPVSKNFRCWNLIGRAVPVPVLLSF
jgi:hypothetical protein